jgi:hypothetical protein
VKERLEKLALAGRPRRENNDGWSQLAKAAMTSRSVDVLEPLRYSRHNGQLSGRERLQSTRPVASVGQKRLSNVGSWSGRYPGWWLLETR